MLGLQEIEKEILSLPKNKYSDFRKWFYSYDLEHWDNKIKEDSKSGKLDFLIKEVIEEKTLSELKSL